MSATAALGWSSQIFDLGAGMALRSVVEVGESVARGMIGVSDEATKVGAGIAAAKGSYASTITALRGGASGTQAAQGFDEMLTSLNNVRGLAKGSVLGRINGALNEGKAVRQAVQSAGDLSPKVTAQLETHVWGLRNHLDEATLELGHAKIMGHLR